MEATFKVMQNFSGRSHKSSRSIEQNHFGTNTQEQKIEGGGEGLYKYGEQGGLGKSPKFFFWF